MKALPARIDRIREFAQSLIDEKLFPNIAWRVALGDSVISEGGVGFQDAQLAHPLRDDAIYRIYSMTKPLVSIVALQLIEENRLSLYQSVAHYIPGFASNTILENSGKQVASEQPLLIEHLLTHRSGLAYDFLPDSPVAALYREAAMAGDVSRSLSELSHALAELPLSSEPGSQWQYSFSTDVLAHVLECVTGKSLYELLKERLFDPLNMQETAFFVKPEQQHRLLSLYGVRDLGHEAVLTTEPNRLELMDAERGYPSDSSTFERGGHGLFSTLADYYRFLQVVMDGTSESGEVLLSVPMVNMMWRNRIPQSQLPLAIGHSPMPGYGWNLFGRVMIDTGFALNLSSDGEGGWSGAASTYFWVDRTMNFRGIVMSQYQGSTLPLGTEMQALAYQALSNNA